MADKFSLKYKNKLFVNCCKWLNFVHKINRKENNRLNLKKFEKCDVTRI